MELTYTQCGDYLIPNLVLADTQEYYIGKYGRMRRAYLKEYRPVLYSTLLLTEKLFSHLAEIDAACKNRLEIIEADMMCREGVTLSLIHIYGTLFVAAAHRWRGTQGLDESVLPQGLNRHPG